MKSDFSGKYSLSGWLAIIVTLFAILGALALLDVTILRCKPSAAAVYVTPSITSAELAQSKVDLTQSQKENQLLEGKLHESTVSGGFMKWPKPSPGKSYYFLVLASVRGTAILPEDPNSSYHLVYDLERKKYVAMLNSGSAIGGRDFVYEVRGEPNGTISFSAHLHDDASALMEKFGVEPGSTR